MDVDGWTRDEQHPQRWIYDALGWSGELYDWGPLLSLNVAGPNGGKLAGTFPKPAYVDTAVQHAVVRAIKCLANATICG